jgi:hypothetical protein
MFGQIRGLIILQLFSYLVLFSLFSEESLNYTSRHVWCLAISEIADIKPNDIINPMRMPTDYADPEKISKGSIIYLRPQHLNDFTDNILNKIKNKVILIINCGFLPFPCKFNIKEYEKIINNEKIYHIFLQNAACENEKITPIPLGLDLHSYLSPNLEDIISQVNQQEEEIDSIRKNSNQKTLMAYCDFQFHDTIKKKNIIFGTSDENRISIFNRLNNSNAIYSPTRRLSRESLWKEKSNFAFSVCPQGTGMDTHRVWEDLALGLIPIVIRSPLDKLYEIFPIVIVDDWQEITKENLIKWHSQYKERLLSQEFQEKLSLNFWKEKILNKKNELILEKPDYVQKNFEN